MSKASRDKGNTFEVWCPEFEDQDRAASVQADTHYEAAKKWAVYFDREDSDYEIAGGREVLLMVRDIENRSLFSIIVSGEFVASYSTRDAQGGIDEQSKQR